MTNYNITDKDFVPYALSHSCDKEEEEEGLYQIVYGVFQDKMTYDNIYDLVVRVCKEQKIEVVKRYKIVYWIDEIDSIIKKLRKFEAENNEVFVFIPFIDEYIWNIQHTIKQFDFVLHVLKKIMEDGDSKMRIKKKPSYSYPLDDTGKLLAVFLNHYINDEIMNRSTSDYEINYWAGIIIDEMIRRGFGYKDEFEFGKSYYKKSIYYNQPQLFFETMSDKAKQLKIKDVEDSDDNDNIETSDTFNVKGKVKEQTKIIYYILKSIAEEKSDIMSRHKQIAFINYLFGEIYDAKKAKDNKIRRYVDEFKKVTSENKEYSFYKRVKDKLDSIGIGVPEIIKDGLNRNKQ